MTNLNQELSSTAEYILPFDTEATELNDGSSVIKAQAKGIDCQYVIESVKGANGVLCATTTNLAGETQLLIQGNHFECVSECQKHHFENMATRAGLTKHLPKI